MNIIKKIFYFMYLINIKRNDKGTSLFSGFIMIWIVFFLYFAPITHFVYTRFSMPFPLKIIKPLKLLFLLYALITAYMSYFKEDKFKMADIVIDYSPWKKPIVGGGICILASIIFSIFLEAALKF